jgi:hypothetical protein
MRRIRRFYYDNRITLLDSDATLACVWLVVKLARTRRSIPVCSVREYTTALRPISYSRMGAIWSAGEMMLWTIIIVILILMLLGTVPTWGHSQNWGYGPSGGIGIVLVILVILMLTGRI